MWIFFLTLTLFVHGNYGQSFTFCNFKDRHPNKCLLNSIQSALKLLRPGIPEYGMKPLDPLHSDKITFGAGGGAVRLTQYYDNVNLTGISDVLVENAHYDDATKNIKILLSGSCPAITQKAHYQIDGAILTFPVFGDGESVLTLVNIKFLLEFKCEAVQRNGKTHLKIVSVLLNIVPQRITMHFGNLFNGNKLLGDNFNTLINEEWQTLYADVKSEIENSYGQIFRDYAQGFFDKVPSDQIFLKN